MSTGLATITRPRGTVVLPDNSQWTNRFEIKSASSNRVYVVAQHKTSRYWACSCPGWIRFRKCKHLATIGLPAQMRPYEVAMKQEGK